MANIRGWARSMVRAKDKKCTLASYGLTFNKPGDKPQTATMMFTQNDEHLNIELEPEEVQKLLRNFTDFIERGGVKNG
jgi:hypothetical protein